MPHRQYCRIQQLKGHQGGSSNLVCWSKRQPVHQLQPLLGCKLAKLGQCRNTAIQSAHDGMRSATKVGFRWPRVGHTHRRGVGTRRPIFLGGVRVRRGVVVCHYGCFSCLVLPPSWIPAKTERLFCSPRNWDEFSFSPANGRSGSTATGRGHSLWFVATICHSGVACSAGIRALSVRWRELSPSWNLIAG